MFDKFSWVMLLVLSTVALSAPTTTTAPASDEEIKKLVSVFSHDDFRVRADATARLIEIGDRAVPFVRDALSARDPEARERAQATLDGIEEKKKIDAAIADGTFKREQEAKELAEKPAIELKDMLQQLTAQQQQLTADVKEKRRAQIYETWPNQKNQFREQYQHEVEQFKADLDGRREELGKAFSQLRQEGLAKLEAQYAQKMDQGLREHLDLLDRQQKELDAAMEPLEMQKVKIQQEMERRRKPS